MQMFKSGQTNPPYGSIPTFEADFAGGKTHGGRADGIGHAGHEDMKETEMMEFDSKRRVLPFSSAPQTMWQRMAQFCYNVRLNWKRELAIVFGIVLVVLVLIIIARVGGRWKLKHEHNE